MKLLAADIGNTNITLGLFNEGAMVGSWRATTRATATADELAIAVSELIGLDGHVLAEIDAVALASVVPPLTQSFERFATEDRMPNVRRENEEKPKGGKNRLSLFALRRPVSFDDVWI